MLEEIWCCKQPKSWPLCFQFIVIVSLGNSNAISYLIGGDEDYVQLNMIFDDIVYMMKFWFGGLELFTWMRLLYCVFYFIFLFIFDMVENQYLGFKHQIKTFSWVKVYSQVFKSFIVILIVHNYISEKWRGMKNFSCIWRRQESHCINKINFASSVEVLIWCCISWHII